jgi:hypothetical protein
MSNLGGAAPAGPARGVGTRSEYTHHPLTPTLSRGGEREFAGSFVKR